MIPCETARALLDERLDRVLDDGETDALGAHLAACPACRAEAAALEEVDGALAGMTMADPGPAFSDRVVAALDRAPGGPAAPAVPVGVRLLSGLVPALGMAAFVALGVALLPIRAAASTVAGMVPEIPSLPIPPLEIPPVPSWAGAAGAVLALALAAATLRGLGGRR